MHTTIFASIDDAMGVAHIVTMTTTGIIMMITIATTSEVHKDVTNMMDVEVATISLVADVV
jgi:hypothetical protein